MILIHFNTNFEKNDKRVRLSMHKLQIKPYFERIKILKQKV